MRPHSSDTYNNGLLRGQHLALDARCPYSLLVRMGCLVEAEGTLVRGARKFSFFVYAARLDWYYMIVCFTMASSKSEGTDWRPKKKVSGIKLVSFGSSNRDEVLK